MAYGKRQQQVREYRGQIPSPGRPAVAWREDRVRFWAAVARGVKTEKACAAAGVSGPVGFWWFRHAGGVNPALPPTLSGRYLSFAEREDIVIWHAQEVGVREIARRLGRDPATVSRELRCNATLIPGGNRHVHLGTDRAVPRLAPPNGWGAGQCVPVHLPDPLADLFLPHRHLTAARSRCLPDGRGRVLAADHPA